MTTVTISPMNRLKQLKTYPFGLFLWLEWILLGCALLTDLPNNYAWTEYNNPGSSIVVGFTLSLLCMLALGAMGLKLPQQKPHKWLYFGLQIALIWLPTFYNHKVDLSFFCCLIVAIRNCIIFRPRECKLASILLFLSFAPSMLFYADYAEFQTRIARYQAITYLEFQKNIGMGIASILVQLALCILFCWVLVNVLLKEHQSQQQLAIAREQLRLYALQAEDRATVHERNRIAREIHDSVGHALTAQSIQLHNAVAFWQDDQAIIRHGLKSLLEIQSDLTVIGDVANGQEALSLISSLQQKSELPDVVLLDVRMPIMDGVATTKELSQHYPEIAVLVLTTFDDEEYISQAMNYGAKGYLLKDSLPEDLVLAIHAVYKGHTHLGPGLFEKALNHTSEKTKPSAVVSEQLAELSPREREVLNLIALGSNNREIAHQLYISEKTVKNHVTSILSKLNLRDRTQAALLVSKFD